jgi:hypothetical protein
MIAQTRFYVPLQKVRTTEFRVGGSLQLSCGEAPLRKPSGMAPPKGEGRRASFVVLPARVRLRNCSDDFLGEGWNRSDLPM